MDYVLILLASLSAALFTYVILSRRELRLREEYDRFARYLTENGEAPPPFESWIHDYWRP